MQGMRERFFFIPFLSSVTTVLRSLLFSPYWHDTASDEVATKAFPLSQSLIYGHISAKTVKTDIIYNFGSFGI